MNKLINKFVELERKISQEKGDFTLFALFLREDAPDKWDLVVAAPWIASDRSAAFYYITSQLQAKLNPEELTGLSRVTLIKQASPALDAINQTIRTNHRATEMKDSVFFGLPIRRAYIITSQNPGMNAEAPVR